ncbi:MAG TPA: hypothetical protein VNO26_14495 [Candidatus Limnocylindria bacterium]|nr:hypothetical protein [Candidatus Limnocylindria bacterium]
MGDLVAFSSFSERRRSRDARRLHEICCALLAASVTAERIAVCEGSAAECAVRRRRLRLFEDAWAYAASTG